MTVHPDYCAQIIRRAERLTHDAPSGCRVWNVASNPDAYPSMSYHDETRRLRSGRAARVVLAAHFGPIPEGLLALHKCDNRHCVRLSHLYLGTYSDNSKDRWQRVGWTTKRRLASIAATLAESPTHPNADYYRRILARG